jgi:hypothetical protein
MFPDLKLTIIVWKPCQALWAEKSESGDEVCSGPYARSGISSPFQRDDVERARVELSQQLQLQLIPRHPWRLIKGDISGGLLPPVGTSARQFPESH